MALFWTFLWVGTLVHGAALYGFSTKGGAAWILFLPLLALPFRTRLNPGPHAPWGARLAGVGTLVATLVFLRGVLGGPWDLKAWGPNLAFALAGFLSLAFLEEDSDEGAGDLLWMGLWLLSGYLDPALPLLGLGVASALRGYRLWPQVGGDKPAPSLSPFALVLLGLALPKPWWDFGSEPTWALAMGTFGLGWALTRLQGRGRLGAALPKGLLLAGLGGLAILYLPVLILPWGLFLGLLAGWTWRRLPRNPTPLAAAFLLGMLLSFALHANAWIPGLRHLIWLGN